MMLKSIWKSFWIFVVFCYFTTVYSQIQCSRNCKTLSADQTNTLHSTISYDIQKNPCVNVTTPNGLTAGEPNYEYFLDNNWYLYQDLNDSMYQKVALNFSWSPSDDGSIMYLRGYSISLNTAPDNDIGRPISETVYFCILHELTFPQHVKAIFYYDLFGYNDYLDFQPEQRLVVIIRSLPESYFETQLLPFFINIPSCDDPTMANVFRCQQERNLTISILNQTCTNPSATVMYNVPALFGQAATLSLATISVGYPIPSLIDEKGNLPSNGNFTFTLPPNSNLSANYTLSVYGSNEIGFRKRVYFDFGKCVVQNNIESNNNVVTIVVVAVVVLVVVTLFFILVNYIRKDPKHFFKQFLEPEPMPEPSLLPEEPILPLSKQIKVYVIFFDDHPKHREVVVQFVNYLIADLAFDVIFQLFETKHLYSDPVGWMMDSLKASDKIIVIWSPGAVERWKSVDKPSPLDHDFFTPVLKVIHNDLFLRKNLLKYVFTYFDYVSTSDIPSEFIKSYPHMHFKLMEKMTDLYFRLLDRERYLHGGILHEKKTDKDTYCDEKATGNKHGHVLHQKLIEMKAYVEKNPNWYKEKKQIPNEIGLFQKEIVPDQAESNILRNILIVAPPEPVEVSYSSNFNSEVSSRADDSFVPTKESKPETENPIQVSIEGPVNNVLEESIAFLSSSSQPSSCQSSFNTSAISDNAMVNDNLSETSNCPNVVQRSQVKVTSETVPLGSVASGTGSSQDASLEECKLPVIEPLEAGCILPAVVDNHQPDSGFASEPAVILPSGFELAPMEKAGDPMDFLVSINKQSGMM